MPAEPYTMDDATSDRPSITLNLTCAVDLDANTETGEPTHLLVMPMAEGFEPARDLNTDPDAGGAVRWKGLIFTTIGESLQVSHERDDADALLAFDFFLGEELAAVRRKLTTKALEVARTGNNTALLHQEITASVLYTIRKIVSLFRIKMGQWRQADWLVVDTP